MLKCPWKQQQCCEEAARENCSTVLLLLLSFHSLLMYRDVRVKLESNETRNDNGFWLKVKTPQTPQSAFPVRHIKDSARPWASIFPLLSFWTAAASARCIPKMLCVFPSLLLSPPPSLPSSTEDLPRLQAAGRPGRHTEQQELWDHLQPADGGRSHGGREGGRRPAGHQHERQRRGRRLNTLQDYLPLWKIKTSHHS